MVDSSFLAVVLASAACPRTRFFQRSRLVFIAARRIFKLLTSFLAALHLAFHWSLLLRKNRTNFETGLRNDGIDIRVTS